MIYFFGDSFTKGDGCNVGFEYYNLPTDLPKHKWTDIISDKLTKTSIYVLISIFCSMRPRQTNQGTYTRCSLA